MFPGFAEAGEEGFEPSTKVLETHVLPLHHSPIPSATEKSISYSAQIVKWQIYRKLNYAEWNDLQMTI